MTHQDLNSNRDLETLLEAERLEPPMPAFAPKLRRRVEAAALVGAASTTLLDTVLETGIKKSWWNPVGTPPWLALGMVASVATGVGIGANLAEDPPPQGVPVENVRLPVPSTKHLHGFAPATSTNLEKRGYETRGIPGSTDSSQAVPFKVPHPRAPSAEALLQAAQRSLDRGEPMAARLLLARCKILFPHPPEGFASSITQLDAQIQQVLDDQAQKAAGATTPPALISAPVSP